MKKLMCFLVAIFLLEAVISHAQPFGPPLYIADPASMKCRYYFAGDSRHFNPRPENYTINIGYTTDFKNESQACELFRCAYTNGSVRIDENKKPIEKDLCVCPTGAYLNNESGCVRLKQEEHPAFLQSFWRWLKGIFKR